MAQMKASPTTPLLLKRPSKSNGPIPRTPISTKIIGNGRWVSLALSRNGGSVRKSLGRRAPVCFAGPAEGKGEVGVLGEEKCEERRGQDGYLVRGFGWGVRSMGESGEEMRRVAEVQAEAFHEPVALFNDFFFEFFKAEVLAALIYRVRNSPPDRYACLVAESINETNSQKMQGLVGVADVTVQNDKDVLRHLDGVEEYLYVSGIAVLTQFRRQKIATVLLRACDAVSLIWGFEYLALRAYEDDAAARKLYSNAGYKVVSGDPIWVSLIGKKRRVLMIKPSALQRTTNI